MKQITKAERRHAIRNWTRADSIRQARAIRTREALATEARFYARQDDRDTETLLWGARTLAELPLASKLPANYFERNGYVIDLI